MRLVRLTSAIALLAVTLAVSACNTTAGVGKDVSAAGNAVTDTAQKVKSGL
jgi:predicted small secreted protein